MTTSREKAIPMSNINTSGYDSPEPALRDHESEVVDIPRGWKYKRFFGLPYYASPQFQLVLVAFVCFLCPGEWTVFRSSSKL